MKKLVALVLALVLVLALGCASAETLQIGPTIGAHIGSEAFGIVYAAK